jgi:DNA replication protein DnaC
MTKTSELVHLFRALKAPAAARALPKLAERAREEGWSYERFAEALLSTEVASRESHGGESRIKAARFPARKTLEEFDFTFQRSVKRQVIEHLGQLDFLHARENVVLLGPPGTGKTHLAIAVSIRACLAGQRVQFASATEWVARLAEAKRQNSLDAELRRLSFIPLLVVDEVGYIPFDPEAANLMFSLVSARYERASLIVTSNKPFSAWGEIFGDEMTAVAMIDRLVHHAEILSLKGDSYVGFDLAAAPRERLALIAATREGQVPVSPRLRFETVAGQWLDRFEAKVAARERHPRTLEAHRYQLDRHLIPALGLRAICVITVDDVAELLHRLRRTGRSAKTSASALATLQSVMRFARRCGWIVAEPVELLEPDERPGRSAAGSASSAAPRSSGYSRLARRTTG